MVSVLDEHRRVISKIGLQGLTLTSNFYQIGNKLRQAD